MAELTPVPGRLVLDIRDLVISYRGRAAVRHVGLQVAAGEIVGLIGESGSGKSSIAMSCLGLLAPGSSVSAERLDVCGTDLRNASARQFTEVCGRDVAMVFQDVMGALDPTMRVGAQLAEVVRRHRRDVGKEQRKATVLGLLETVGIREPERRARQYPYQLSGGLQQRCAIALALAGSPKLLLADEPTTALDVTVQAGILRLFRKIRDEMGVGILLISHDIGVIAQTADRVNVMLNGEIVEHGAVADVLVNPANSQTRRLLRSVPRLDRPLASVDSGSGPAGAGSRGAGAGRTGADQAGAGRAQTEHPVVKLAAGGVSRVYGSRRHQIHALHPVDLEIRQGEVLGVVGESGSGKSTLAKLLVHLEPPSTGRITVDDQEVSRLRGHARQVFRRAVQMVFQHPASSLDPRLKAGASVGEPLRAAGVDARVAAARVIEVLGEVGLDAEFARRLPHEMSGGQRQRVAIARAIAGEPSVVVLDEPTSALDVSVQAQVLELLGDVQQRENLTYVFISHNLAVVRSISDRVAVMYAGRIVELAPAADLFDRPAHWYTAELLAAVPSVVPPDRGAAGTSDRELASAAATGDGGSSAESGCAFASRCPAADGLCRTVLPPLAELHPGHRAACHHPVARAGGLDTSAVVASA